MTVLTPEGEKIVAGLAEQYKIGAEAVRAMLDAVARGGGTAARFNVPELGGPGQWMRGAPDFMGSMLNSSMKASVDGLCNELSSLLQAQAGLFAPAASNGNGSTAREAASRAKTEPEAWWPQELGKPTHSGSRNAFRYAYFAGIRRLAADSGEGVEVYDTTGFAIEGLAPQQADGGGAPVFISNRGPVRLSALPREHGFAADAVPEAAPPAAPVRAGETPEPGQIVALIEQLASLKEKGVLTGEEFAAKKAELLKRL